MPLREGKRRVDMDAEAYDLAAEVAAASKVSIAWLIGQLVAEGLNQEDGAGSDIVRRYFKRRELQAVPPVPGVMKPKTVETAPIRHTHTRKGR